MFQTYKKLIAFFLLTSAFSINGFDLSGEGIKLSGEINSTSLTDSGGVIDVVSDNEKYGKTCKKPSFVEGSCRFPNFFRGVPGSHSIF